jgi:hypothetical protein
MRRSHWDLAVRCLRHSMRASDFRRFRWASVAVLGRVTQWLLHSRLDFVADGRSSNPFGWASPRARPC